MDSKRKPIFAYNETAKAYERNHFFLCDLKLMRLMNVVKL